MSLTQLQTRTFLRIPKITRVYSYTSKMMNSTVSSNVKELSSLPEFQNHIKSSSLSVIDFYATWCGPCKAISPIIEQLSTKLTDVNFGKVDVDAASDIAQEYGITAMPTFLLFKDGLKIDTVIGANPQGLLKKIKENGGKLDL